MEHKDRAFVMALSSAIIIVLMATLCHATWLPDRPNKAAPYTASTETDVIKDNFGHINLWVKKLFATKKGSGWVGGWDNTSTIPTPATDNDSFFGPVVMVEDNFTTELSSFGTPKDGTLAYCNHCTTGAGLYAYDNSTWNFVAASATAGVTSVAGLTDVVTITGGTGVTATVSGQDIGLENTGVTSIAAGNSGITVSGSTGAVTISKSATSKTYKQVLLPEYVDGCIATTGYTTTSGYPCAAAYQDRVAIPFYGNGTGAQAGFFMGGFINGTPTGTIKVTLYGTSSATPTAGQAHYTSVSICDGSATACTAYVDTLAAYSYINSTSIKAFHSHEFSSVSGFANEPISVKVYRTASNTGDTFTGTIYIYYAVIEYTVSEQY